MTAFPIRTFLFTSAAAVAAVFFVAPADKAMAASSEGCEGGGYTIRLSNGTTIG